MIRLRARVRPYWVHIGWMALILLIAIQNWLGWWEVRDWPGYGFVEYVSLLTPSLALVVLTFVICPGFAAQSLENLEEYYYSNLRWIFGLLAVFLVGMAVTDSLVRSEPWLGASNGVRFAGTAVVLFLATTKNRNVHGAALPAAYGLFVVFVLIGAMGG